MRLVPDYTTIQRSTIYPKPNKQLKSSFMQIKHTQYQLKTQAPQKKKKPASSQNSSQSKFKNPSANRTNQNKNKGNKFSNKNEKKAKNFTFPHSYYSATEAKSFVLRQKRERRGLG